jgi:hypothetical protein
VQGASPLYLPGLQEVRGQWSGNIQAYGGGTGTTSCDFDLKGQGWQWGTYGLDAVLAAGSFHSEEGLQLQEFVLKAGDAKLSVRGSLLGEHQDASLLLTDFPMATLRPLFRRGQSSRLAVSCAASPADQCFLLGQVPFYICTGYQLQAPHPKTGLCRRYSTRHRPFLQSAPSLWPPPGP